MNGIPIPTDRLTYEGEIATYWFDDGILVSLSKSVLRTVENISGNVALVKRITGDKPVPLLVYLSNSPVPDNKQDSFQLLNSLSFIPPWRWFQNQACHGLS